MSTYPLQDAVAIVGLGTTDYARDDGHKTKGHLAVEACMNAITDAGLTAADVDGLCGSNFQASPQYVQKGLGVPTLTWWCSAWGPFTQLLSEAVHAVFAGACSVAVVYQGQVRTVRTSSSVDMTDPVRSVPDPGRSFDHHSDAQYYRPYGGRRGTYAGYMNRYMNEYHVPRESFGLVAVNNRSHATANPHAVLRDPLSMNDYLDSRFVRFPMCLNDIDYAIDGGDAVVVTTLERAPRFEAPSCHRSFNGIWGTRKPGEGCVSKCRLSGPGDRHEHLMGQKRPGPQRRRPRLSLRWIHGHHTSLARELRILRYW